MRRKLLITTGITAGLFGLAALPLTVSAEPNDSPAAESTLDPELLSRTLDALHDAAAPGSVVAEVRDGDEVWTEARGERDPQAADATEPTDRVRVASLTKSMVATVFMQLSADGQLDLDDEVAEHLPESLPYDEPVTVRQLLNHTGGVPDYFQHLYPSLLEGSADDVRNNRYDEYSVEEVVDMGTQDPLHFAPGEGYSYSNTSYYVLGQIVEELTGDSIESALQQQVFDAVGMDDSYVPERDTHLEGPHPRAFFYTAEPDDPHFDSTDLSPTHMWAAGGVVSNVADVNDFYQALSDGTLLSQEQLEEVREVSEPSVDAGGPYGLGLARLDLPPECEPIPDGESWGHTGGGLGYSTFSFHSPDGERQVSFTYTLDPQLDPGHEVYAAMELFLLAGACDLSVDDVSDAQVSDQLQQLVRTQSVAGQ